MTGFVYAIEAADGRIKIGWSSDPIRRLTKISTDCSSSVRLLGMVSATKAQEAELLNLLTPWRVHRDWFRNEGAVSAFLALLPKPRPRKRSEIFAEAGAHPLKIWRAEHGVTLEASAKVVGLGISFLSLVESRQKNVSLVSLKRITEATGLSAILFFPESRSPAVSPARDRL